MSFVRSIKSLLFASAVTIVSFKSFKYYLEHNYTKNSNTHRYYRNKYAYNSKFSPQTKAKSAIILPTTTIFFLFQDKRLRSFLNKHFVTSFRSPYYTSLLSIFSHSDPTHFLFNMYAFNIFSSALLSNNLLYNKFEYFILPLFVSTGTIASSLSRIINYYVRNNYNNVGSLGASGGVMGILGAAYAFQKYGNRISDNNRYMFFPIPIPMNISQLVFYILIFDAVGFFYSLAPIKNNFHMKKLFYPTFTRNLLDNVYLLNRVDHLAHIIGLLSGITIVKKLIFQDNKI